MSDGQNDRDLHLEGVQEGKLHFGAVPDRIDAHWVYTVRVGAFASARIVARLEEVEWQRHEIVVHEPAVDGEKAHHEEHVAELVQVFDALEVSNQWTSKQHQENCDC